jgi:hypothetical protein
MPYRLVCREIEAIKEKGRPTTAPLPVIGFVILFLFVSIYYPKLQTKGTGEQEWD